MALNSIGDIGMLDQDELDYDDDEDFDKKVDNEIFVPNTFCIHVSLLFCPWRVYRLIPSLEIPSSETRPEIQ